MSWRLTEQDQAELMQAVAAAVQPHVIQLQGQIEFEGEMVDITMPGIDPDAPAEIRALGEIYEKIIERGALATSPRMVVEQKLGEVQARDERLAQAGEKLARGLSDAAHGKQRAGER